MAIDLNYLVGTEIKALVPVDLYKADASQNLVWAGTIGTAPGGTDLGQCISVIDLAGSIGLWNFFAGHQVWLIFDKPSDAIDGVTDQFSIIYSPGTISSNGTVVNDANPTGAQKSTDWISKLFGSIENLIWILIVLALILGVLFIWSNYIKN
jgi:hypothetical protein